MSGLATDTGADLAVARKGDVLIVRWNRPDKKNALTGAMYDGAAGLLEDANGDDGVAVIVFFGLPGAFTAGNDIGDFLRMAGEGAAIGAPILRFLRALVRADKPLIAGVDGLAVGIGTTMLFHCDHVVMSDRTVLRTPFVDLGLVPEAASSLIGPRLMGHAAAFELLVLGRDLDAAGARRAGLANVVAEPAQVEETTLATAAALAAKPRQAMLAARRLLKGDRDALLRCIDEEAEQFANRLASPEAQAAFAAFMTRNTTKDRP